jgi:hypothetical protein
MSDRPINIGSLNIRGLGKDSPKQKLIRTWLASLQKPPQILLLQEHHLDASGVSNATKGIKYWQGKAFWNPGIPMGTSPAHQRWDHHPGGQGNIISYLGQWDSHERENLVCNPPPPEQLKNHRDQYICSPDLQG